MFSLLKRVSCFPPERKESHSLVSPPLAGILHTMRLQKAACLEKASYEDIEGVKTPGKSGQWAIVLCQHVLLWLSYLVLGSTIYFACIGVVRTNTLPGDVLLVAAVSHVPEEVENTADFL